MKNSGLLVAAAAAAGGAWWWFTQSQPAPAAPAPAPQPSTRARHQRGARSAHGHQQHSGYQWGNDPSNTNAQGAGFDPVTGDYGDSTMMGGPDNSMNTLQQPNGQPFDALDFLAANPDLIARFGSDTTAALDYYTKQGHSEGRNIHFDPMEYLASNPDLIGLIGLDPRNATANYVTEGYYLNRPTGSFDPIAYQKSHPALAGMKPAAVVLYYVTTGYSADQAGS